MRVRTGTRFKDHLRQLNLVCLLLCFWQFCGLDNIVRSLSPSLVSFLDLYTCLRVSALYLFIPASVFVLMFFVAARQPDVLQSTNQDAMRLGNQNASLKTGKYISVMSSTINRLYS